MKAPVQNPRPVRQLPEPARFWIGYAPRMWRATDSPWCDLARLQLEGLKPPPTLGLPRLDAEDLGEVLYLPPVAQELVGDRSRLLAELVEAGVSTLVQLVPGEPAPAVPAIFVYDLLRPLLEGELDVLAELPAGSSAVWPLIAGVTDQVEIWEEGCELLVQAGVSCVQATALELSPLARRRLAEGRDDDVFDALFHGQPPSERGFAQVAREHGLGLFLERPEVAGPQRRVRNRRIGSRLAMIGELWMRLGRPVGAGHAFFRAARGAESTLYDLVGLVREKNLSVMDWLDAAGVEAVTEIVENGESSLLEKLREHYLSDQPSAAFDLEEAEGEDDNEEDDG